MFRRLLVVSLLGTIAIFAQPGISPKQAPKGNTPPVAPKPQAVTVDGVIDMVRAGLSDDVIIARLRKEDKPFDLSTDDLIRLKKASVGDGVLKVMMDPKAETKALPQSVPPAAPPTQQQAPIVVQAPFVPGLPNPSGATPNPGTSAVGDPNDPMTPHDSGIYLYTKDRDGKPQMILLERAAYQGAKMGMGLCAVTGGIKKCKEKAVIPGSRASIRTSDTSPVFYFYFDDKAAGLGKAAFGGSVSNPNQFALIKLEIAKANRETTIGEFGAFSSSTGTDSKSMIGVKSERIRTGLYKVVPNGGLQPGEYCFLASQGNLGAFGAGAAGAADIFDFGVSIN